MASEIRANTLKNRVGLGTVSFTNTGPVVSGIVTIANSTAAGVRLEDNAGVGGSLKITTPSGYVSIGAGNAAFVHLNTDRGSYYFQKRIIVDEGIIGSYDENLTLQSPLNTNRVTINKDTGLVSILNDLDVDGHTNLDNVSVAGVSTFTGGIDANSTLEVAGVANFDSTIQLADTIEHLGDSNTKIRFPTTDTFSVETAGSERLRITSGGKVTMTSTTNNQRGLSVIAPKSQIQWGTTADVGGFLMSTNNGQFGLSGGGYWSGSSWIATHTASTQIRTDGDGDISFCSNASLTSGSAFTPAEKVTIRANGRVGFNNNNPQFVIHTEGSGNNGGVRLENSHTTTTVSGNTAAGAFPHNLILSNYGGSGTADNRMVSLGFDIPTTVSHANAQIVYQATGSNGVGDLQFWLENGNTSYERARFTAAGQFLMGTTSSTGARVIIQQNSSDTNFSDQQTCADSSGMRLHNYSFSTGRYTALSMECCNSSSVQSASIIAQSSASGTSPNIIFTQRDSNTTNKERLRITPRGYREIRNYHYGAYSFTNNSWKSTFTIGDPGDGKFTTIKFILTLEDVSYRQGFWQGEFVIWSSNSNGGPGVTHIYKKIWDNKGSSNWNGGTVSYQMSGGAFQFKASNDNSDAGGSAYIHVLDVIGDVDGSSVATITA